MVTQGETLRLCVVELVSADFMGELEVECLSCLRHLPGRRSVWLARCENRNILLKLYDPHPKQKRDAGDEWRQMVVLQELGLNIPEPLFFAKSDDGLLAVAMNFILDGVTLDKVLATSQSETQKEALSQLVSLHAKLHASGCYQSDDHLGNYLWSHGKLWILDGGSFVFKSAALTDADCLKNMAMLAANIPLPMRAAYDAAFLISYDKPLDGLESAITQAIQVRARNYYKKTRRACSEFEYEEGGGVNWLACRDISPGLKEKLLKNPDQFFEGLDGDDLLKNGNTCTVVEVVEGERSYILKRYNQKSLGYRLRHLLMTSRALASWSNGHVLRLFGVSTPRPVACLLLKTGGLIRRGYLLMEKADAIPLSKVDHVRMSDPAQKIPVAFAQIWWQLGVLDATHGDMKASNLMVDKAGCLTLIDLDSLEFHHSRSRKMRGVDKDMRRFMRNWEEFPVVQNAFKTSTSS